MSYIIGIITTPLVSSKGAVTLLKYIGSWIETFEMDLKPHGVFFFCVSVCSLLGTKFSPVLRCVVY